RDQHPLPTRRSSDLGLHRLGCLNTLEQRVDDRFLVARRQIGARLLAELNTLASLVEQRRLDATEAEVEARCPRPWEGQGTWIARSEEHTSELQSLAY